MSGSEGNGIEQKLARLGLVNDAQMPTPPPPLPVDGFRDITDYFFEESKKLNVGELVKDPCFTLLQAVGALEIMDPKMDSGLLEPEYESFDALKPRLPEEIIGIMDHLLCHEMAWHMGHALSQTLYTCLYIDKLLSTYPRKLEDATFGKLKGNAEYTEAQELVVYVLRPYCLALIKCCGYVNKHMLSEQLYEEEDFVTQTYGLPLLDAVYLAAVSNLVTDAREWLMANEGRFPKEILAALLVRLSLRHNMLLDLSRDAGAYRDRETLSWNDSLERIKEVVATHELGKPVEEAWSTSVQRKLASQVPPRPIVEFSFDKAVVCLRQLCNEAMDLTKLLDFESASNTMNYFLHFAARKPTPLPYTRSLIQCILIHKNVHIGGMSTGEILFDDLKELCSPMDELFNPENHEVEVPSSPKYKIAKHMEWFVERAGKQYFDLHRMIVQNRSRWRRNLCHLILDWDSLQVEAEEVDTELRDLTGEEPLVTAEGPPAYSFPLSSWVYHYKLRMMEWIILLGFELDIYQPHESSGSYWYLQHYLRTRIGHLERIRTFLRPPASESSSNEEYQKTQSFVNFQLLEATAMQELATALVYLYGTLNRLGLLEVPAQPYGTDLLRYELRMKPFLHIGCPEVVPFEIFQNIVDNSEIATADLLEFAKDNITQAKKLYIRLSKLNPRVARTVQCEVDYRANMGLMLKSCFGISVAIGVLARDVAAGTASSENLVMTLERANYHQSFPVPSIKQRKS
ncbi:Mak10 subunit, NatC N-terminal acetyltransferase-domain-containing protein [Geopyxis carbonaria]|nr:Mak10 subunit, NatC N-terminal acetyltransferase-domain-containing protein [Geopyxis carbonaria]